MRNADAEEEARSYYERYSPLLVVDPAVANTASR